MSISLLAFLAVLPILLAIILIAGFRLAARYVMPALLILTAGIAWGYWGVGGWEVLASVIRGWFITFDILVIIFGAILLLSVLKHSGALSSIRYSFTHFSPDRRVQIVLIVWLFGSFIEGVSGFGTPAAVVAPLLVALGFPALSAVMLGMMVQSTAVTFGSMGTPVLIGLNNGLVSGFAGQEEKMTFLLEATRDIVILHGIAGTFMPWAMIFLCILFFGKKGDLKKAFTIAPFAVFSGLAFTVPYMLAGWLLGPEFPTMLGALCGLLIVNVAVKRNFLLPEDTWDFPGREGWPASWSGNMSFRQQPDGEPAASLSEGGRGMKLFLAWMPYLIVSALLILTRQPDLGLGELLKRFSITWPSVIGTGVSASTTPLYLPGTLLVLTACITFFLHRMQKDAFGRAVKESVRMTLAAGFVLAFTVPMVQIYINSGLNDRELQSMPVTMAGWASLKFGEGWPLLAPSIGALGAFIAGSNTVSNLMFADFQYNIAAGLNMSPEWIVSLQAVGAAAGNMVAIHNVVAASATVGMLGQEGNVLRRTIIPTIYYLLVTGIIGWLVT